MKNKVPIKAPLDFEKLAQPIGEMILRCKNMEVFVLRGEGVEKKTEFVYINKLHPYVQMSPRIMQVSSTYFKNSQKIFFKCNEFLNGWFVKHSQKLVIKILKEDTNST